MTVEELLSDARANTNELFSEPESLENWFLGYKVRMYVEDNNKRHLAPSRKNRVIWFCLADIAKLMCDKNYKRFIPSKQHTLEMYGKLDKLKQYTMLDPNNLYRYLSRSRHPLAENLQDKIYDIIERLHSMQR